MKVENLSIGDWVNVRNYHYDGSPLQAKINGIIKKHGTYYLQFSRTLYAEIDRCEPIPITPEIMEKNGFKGKGNAILKIDENIWLDYYYFEHRLQRWWEGIDEWNNHAHVKEISVEMQCYYVHELQHALRFCGVDLEIKLEGDK